MKILLIALIQICSFSLWAQNYIGIVCDNFKFNNVTRKDGFDFRKSLESVLSNLKTPPLIIERENMRELIIKIQEEANLKKDLNEIDKSILKSANVDWILYANFNKKAISENYDLQLECVKISGENIFSKKIFPIISFDEKELNNTQVFREKLNNMLKNYAFTKDFGILEDVLLDKINERMAILSGKIDTLTKANELKERIISQLDLKVNDINSNIIQKEKKEFEIKHSAPSVQIQPYVDTSGDVNILINLLNQVPIQLTINIERINDSHNKAFRIYPPEVKKIFPIRPLILYYTGNINRGDFGDGDTLDVQVTVKYSSIYFDEIGDPKLKNTFQKVYQINRKTLSLIEK
jgi:hypothetical protein